MNTVLSFFWALCFFSNAHAAVNESNATQVLLEEYNISVVSDTCVERGYEIITTYPCYSEIQVEQFAQKVLKKVQALQMDELESTVELRLSAAWILCFKSGHVIKVSNETTPASFKVQGCNLDDTLQALENTEINTSWLLPN